MIYKIKITVLLIILTTFSVVGQGSTGILFSGTFGGAIVEDNTYTNPTGAEAWAGFANEDLGLYPINFNDPGELSFTGASSGADVEVYFRFEYNPYPDAEPSFSTTSVTISGSTDSTYTLSIPAQGSNTFSSFLLYVNTQDVAVTLTNVILSYNEYTDPCDGVVCPEGEECLNGICVIDLGNGGPTIAAPTPPAREPGNVISIFSDAYENVILDNFDFGLCGSSAVEDELIEGDLTQYYNGSGCQGISMASNRIDASEFTNIHFDFYTNASEEDLIGKVFNLKLVDWGGNVNGAISTGLEINFNGGSNPPLASGSWVSVDIDISQFGLQVIGDLTRNDVAEIHITSNLVDAWYDNIYLYKETYIPGTCTDGELNQDETGIDCGGICEPCTGPPSVGAPLPPARDPEDVISIYSDTYNNVIIDNFDFGLCGSSAVDEISLDGNNTQHYSGAGCQGISMEGHRINASAFTHIHFDFYTNGSEEDLIGRVFNLKLVDWGGNSTEDGATGLEVNFNTGTNPAIVAGEWVSVDVNINNYGPMVIGNLTISDIAQIHITSNLPNAWYDNLYIYRTGLTPETCTDGIQNQGETGIDCGGICEPCVVEISGCTDENATNYDATATTQALDQYGNLSCLFASCDDVPEPGCIYVDGFGIFNSEFGPEDCVTYGGTPCTLTPETCSDGIQNQDETGIDCGGVCEPCIVEISGCMDENATNYDALATTQSFDQYSNLSCLFASCDDVPEPGCIYVDGFGIFNSEFGAEDCVSNGGTPCVLTGFSIEENELQNTKVYPNPSNGNLTVHSEILMTGDAEIKLYDLLGNLVYVVNVNDAKVSSHEINISNLKPGTYLLTVSNGLNTTNTRVVRQ